MWSEGILTLSLTTVLGSLKCPFCNFGIISEHDDVEGENSGSTSTNDENLAVLLTVCQRNRESDFTVFHPVDSVNS